MALGVHKALALVVGDALGALGNRSQNHRLILLFCNAMMASLE